MAVIEGNGFNYALDNRLIKKLDIMIDRTVRDKPKLDAWLAIEGSEGSGKTNTACACAYYVKQKTGKDIHLFFRLEPLIKMAQSTEGKIFCWDEPSLDSLSTDQLKTVNRNLLRLAMTIRKKRHFFFINFTKFWKFSEYIVVDRCLGMVHMYSKNEIEMGKSVYIKKRNLEKLWNEYNKSKRRSYGKLRAFFASFPEIMGSNMEKMGIFVDGKPNATYADYERAKDRAINSIGKDDKPKSKKEGKYEQAYRELRKKVADLDYKNIKNKEDLARKMGVGKRTFQSWGHLEGEDEFEEDKEAKKLGLDDNVPKGHLSAQDDDESDEIDESDDKEVGSGEDKDQLQKLIEEMDEDNDKDDSNSKEENVKPNWRR
jgi:hypothetical protein